MKSLTDQAIWRRREHEKGENLSRPVLTGKQMIYLRKCLDLYQEDLWQIACRRLGVDPDLPYEREDEPVDEEWSSNGWSQLCGCGAFATIEHCGEHYCASCRRGLNETDWDLETFNQMIGTYDAAPESEKD